MPNTKRSEVVPRESLFELLDHGLRSSVPLALALADIDDFAEVNDKFGFESGDNVLAAFEAVLKSNAGPDASVLRLGGDEYAVVLPGQSAENAVVLLDEIRRHFFEHRPEGVDAT